MKESYREAIRQARHMARTSQDWTRIAREIREAEAYGAPKPQADPFQTPEYVHRLLDSWLSGEPLDFKGALVPDGVERRILDYWADKGVPDDDPLPPVPDTGEQMVNLAAYVERVNAAEADIVAVAGPECEHCGGALRVEQERIDVTPYPGVPPQYMPGMRTYVHVLEPTTDHAAVPRKTPRPGDVGGETTAIIDAVRVNGLVENAATEVIEHRYCMHCGNPIYWSPGDSPSGVWLHAISMNALCQGENWDARRERTFAWPAAVTEG